MCVLYICYRVMQVYYSSRVDILLAAVERLDSQRFDVDDRRFESPGQYVHRGRVVPNQQNRFDGTHTTGPKHPTVDTARFVMLFPVFKCKRLVFMILNRITTTTQIHYYQWGFLYFFLLLADGDSSTYMRTHYTYNNIHIGRYITYRIQNTLT